ncbi:hypothetical protein Tco_0852671 [Tanacetum coccineum]
MVTNEELITKKLIKFKLGGRGPSLTLLQFARRLGLYHSAQICEEGFEVYFQGGLRSDEHFNARGYWLSISSEDKLNLSRSATQTIRSPVLRVLQNMITYGLRQRTIGSLDATTIRELIGSNRRLIVEDPTPGVPRVAMPRPSRPTMQDLYERIGNMEIPQGVLERMSRRQPYHSDRYAGVFKYMAGQYNIPLQRAYAPPGYDEEKQQEE